MSTTGTKGLVVRVTFDVHLVGAAKAVLVTIRGGVPENHLVAFSNCLAVHLYVPSGGPPEVSEGWKHAQELLNSARALREKGHKLYATRGTCEFLNNAGVEAHVAYWPDENNSPNTIELIKSREVDLVVNIPKDLSATELNNDYTIRRSAVDFNVPLITNDRRASAFILACCKLDIEDLAIQSWDEYK